MITPPDFDAAPPVPGWLEPEIAVDLDAGDDPREKCGVIGIYTPELDSATYAYFGLFALQHRGQESAGMAVSDGRRVKTIKDMGLVSQVFTRDRLDALKGHLAIGHTRYSTSGVSEVQNAQPIFCQYEEGEIAVAHNGNLVNTKSLRQELIAEGEVFGAQHASSDSELIARIIARNIGQGIEFAVGEVMRRCHGAFSITVLTPKAIIGFRDPYGIRPLTAGTIGERGYMVASETCAFGPVGGKPVRELAPGEMVIIDDSGMRFSQGAPTAKPSMCLFEFIYFARPDSRMYGQLLYQARYRMGQQLARQWPVEADIVVPVPDSGIPAALGYAREAGIEFREGMMKSRYIHRTFIQPSKAIRELGVRMKLTPLEEHLAGQRVVLVDDSIVRGTTTDKIVSMLRDAGAREVHVRITAPPIIKPCFYGINMATEAELISANLSTEALRQRLGCDTLGFLSIDRAVDSVGRPKADFCLACFNNDYPIPIPNEAREDSPQDGVGEFSVTDPGQPTLIE
ncbi:MAG: amidophosphoribosyltransferase [Fimbriimonadaceae bacterium]|nr:amidophosphoribosyltransferase [Fimbriimonadaceae bacterium]